MARPRKYTDAEIVAALKAKRGMVYHAADKLGCHADTIHDRAKVSPAVARCIGHERGKVIDTAEEKLFNALRKNEPWAIQLTLKTLGKGRGYVEKQEIESTNKTTLEIVEEIVEAPREDPQDGPAAPGPG